MNKRVSILPQVGLKEAVLTTMDLLGFNRAAKRLLRDKPRILMFHKVVADTASSPMHPGQEHHVNTSLFEKIVDYLRQNYQLVTLEQLIEDYLTTGCFRENSAVITFDDGFLNFKQQAFPVLKKYGAPATLFICPGLVDQEPQSWVNTVRTTLLKDTIELPVDIRRRVKGLACLDVEEQLEALKGIIESGLVDIDNPALVPCAELLSWKDIVELKQSGLVEIGSHTITHPVLSRRSVMETAIEIAESKKAIERKLGIRVVSFCYPRGNRSDFDQQHVEQVRSARYLCAVTAKFGLVDMHSDLFQLPRFGGDFGFFMQSKKYIDGVEFFQRKIR